MERVLPHGTVIAFDGGLPVEIRDRGGAVHASLAWEGDALLAIIVPLTPAPRGADPNAGAPGDSIVVTGARVPHPVLGAAHRILRARDPDAPGEHIATCGAVSWARPDRIPAIDRPGALPAGTGTALMNLIALLAEGAGIASLRYAGPYPTMALWSTLAECFRPAGEPDAARERFLDDAEGLALRGETVTVDVDLVPAPFERVVVAPGTWVQLRGDLERASIAGRSYARAAAVRRIVDIGDHRAAQIWLAGAPWHEAARFAVDGALIDGPHPRPRITSAVIGQVFPPALVAALAELCAEGEPALLAPALREALIATPIRWGDAGDDAAAIDDGGIIVHALLWERLGPRGMSALALGLAEALLPLARRLGQDRLARQT